MKGIIFWSSMIVLVVGLITCSKTKYNVSHNYALQFNVENIDTIYSQKYTCDGEGISPEISWSNAPIGTKSYAITMHHILGPGDKHVYMVIYDIDSAIHHLAENTSNIGSWGINTVNETATYTPPCSQGGGDKIYTITVYALSMEKAFTSSQSKVTMDNLLKAIEGKVLGTTKIDVTYSR